jgi:hypothetical protein
MDASHGPLPVGHPVVDRHWQRHTTRQRRALRVVPGDALSLGLTTMRNLAIG